MSDLDKSGADLQQYKVLRDTAGQGYAGVPHFCVFPFFAEADNSWSWRRNSKLKWLLSWESLLWTHLTQTTSTLLAFFLAMMLYPTVQKQAQEELDKVCSGRLPDFSDRQSLPYINALCVELIRWSAVAPLGGAYTCNISYIYSETQYILHRCPTCGNKRRCV